MFTNEIDQIFIVYQIREGIVRMGTMFSPSSRDAVIQRDGSELILAPTARFTRVHISGRLDSLKASYAGC